VLADRYRIVGLLGKGGMGEVYRADDLKLDQAVALKFLPESLGLHPQALARFHAEVRIARQVSHPNVCRVYDIGEVDGLHFLTMELIDGEDLSSLLRRIGRLPSDKAVEIARQLNQSIGLSLSVALALCVVVLGLRVALRTGWLTAMVCAILAGLAGGFSVGGGWFAPGGISFGFLALLVVGSMMRFGLIAAVAVIAMFQLLAITPTTLDMSAWYASTSVFTLIVVVAVAGYACYLAVGSPAIGGRAR
jgi:hypothetical protein